MSIYVNRTLNMKQIEAIGFDMDYTLVRYQSENFEAMAYQAIKRKLIETKKYPAEIDSLNFQYDMAIRGLVIDKPLGNILKLSTFSKVKQVFHGAKEMSFKEQQKIYLGLTIDLNDTSRFSIVDTTFSIAYCVLYMQVVSLKDKSPELLLPDYKTIEEDILESLDLSHRDGTLKSQVRQDVQKYVMQDEEAVRCLERLKRHGKQLWVITNSDFEYTKLLLDYTINPFLKNHSHWSELFNLTITFASKPKFFTERAPLLQIDPSTGFMRNHHGRIEDGIYQGGNAFTIQKNSGLSGEQILYLGDHIYGDVLKIKKTCNWRTALVIDELISEIDAIAKTAMLEKQITFLMDEKVTLEKKIDAYYDGQIDLGQKIEKEKVKELMIQIEAQDKKVSALIHKRMESFNANWGETMRAGLEPSRLAGQIEKYACIYMARIANFLDYSPRTYFRPKKKALPHDPG